MRLTGAWEVHPGSAARRERSIASLARARFRRSSAVRAGVFAVALIVVAEGAVLLLAPREEGIPPADVAEGEFLDAGQVERAVSYRDGQRLLLLFGLGLQVVAVGALAVGRPRAARRALERAARRPLLGAAAAGVVVVAVAELAALPTSIAAHERAVDAGISTQSLGPWLGDQARGLAISAAIAALGAVALAALIRRHPRRWWIPGTAAVVGFGAAMTLLSPILIAPRFNDFEELPEGSALRDDVLELGRRAGVDVGEVYRVDASRRATSLNAYVAGLGPTKRVVLYDTLIDDAERPELESVVAHELGHVAHSDIPRGITFAALVAPLGLLLVRELSTGLGRRAGAEPGTPAAIPALFLAIAVVSFAVNIAGNQLSRKVEASADAFALRITDDPRALIGLQTRLAERNLSDPDPPAIARVLFGTHPTTLERIGSALAWERGER
jgi:STE24 endopeptidase